jgi:hypothetical protein
MRKILTVLLFFVLVVPVKAQNGIEYVFPKKVEMEINQFIKLNESKNFYIVFDKTNNKDYFISVLILEDRTVKDTKTLIKKTKRFITLSNKNIPIIFQSDTDFLFLGRDDRGRLKRRAVMYHGFEVVFTYDGEIIKASQLIKSSE